MNEEMVPKRINIRHYRAFLAVSKHKNLTRAAESLHITQSALSLTIGHLEADLGIVLFDRSTRRLDLSSAGREFQVLAEKVVRDFDRSIIEMRAISNQERGEVGIAAVPSVMALMVPQAASIYMEAFPSVDIYLREDNSEAVLRRVIDGDVDIGVSSLWETSAELDFEPIFKDTFGVVFNQHHPLRTRKEIRWEDILNYTMIGFSPDVGVQRVISQTFSLSQELREPRYRVSNTATIEALLMHTGCISVMSALAAMRAPLDRLEFRPLIDPMVERTVGILTKRGSKPTPAASSMLDYLRDSLEGIKKYKNVEVLI